MPTVLVASHLVTYVTRRSHSLILSHTEIKFPGGLVADRKSNYVNRVRATGSIPDSERLRRRDVITEENLDEVPVTLQTSPR